MKFIVTEFNKIHGWQRLDGWFLHNFIAQLKNYHTVINEFFTQSDIESSDAIIFPRAWAGDYTFDTELFIKCQHKPFIVVDFSEYGYRKMIDEEYLTARDILGEKTDNYFWYNWSPEHHKLMERFLDCDIRINFKRELSKTVFENQQRVPVVPIDYFCYNMPVIIPASQEEFYARPIELFHVWGPSNMERARLQGKIMMEIDRMGHDMFTSKAQLDEYLKANGKSGCVLMRADSYERIKFFEIQKLCKTVLDLFGCGMKCFRNWEAALDSISIKQDPSLLVRAFPWTPNVNCITLPTKVNTMDYDVVFEIIYEFIRGPKQHLLYPIYKEGISHVRKYDGKYYFENHVLPLINKHLKKD
ncbi:MAG TPA: hypothetical protein PLC59_11685 [Bacteroidales bacterium]|nr:hypothetical protein [Bacteroidales bacterium]